MGFFRRIKERKTSRKAISDAAHPITFEMLEPRLMLSADLSLTAMAGQSLDLTLQFESGRQELQIIDNTNQSVLQSQPLAETRTVSIKGADQEDKLTVDFTIPFTIPEGITFEDSSAGGDNTLKVVGKANIFNITGENEGNVNGTGVINFADIKNLIGGEDADTFKLTKAGSISGEIDGSAGGDSLWGPEADTIWNITAEDAGNVKSVVFRGIENLLGAANNKDTFVFATAGAISNTIDGGLGGFDAIEVQNSSYDIAAFDYTGFGSGNIELDGAIISSYFKMETIILISSGRDPPAAVTLNIPTIASDEFTIRGDSTTINGIITIDSTNGTLTDTIFEAPIGSLKINSGPGSDIITIDLLEPGFSLFINGQAGQDTIIGPDADCDWNITGTDSGTVAGVIFTNIENLIGGTGSDTFIFADGGQISGLIDGGWGTNTLDYSHYTTDVAVGLYISAATGTGGVRNIQNVTGGAGNDSLIGDEAANSLIGGPGNDVLTGGQGGDTLDGGDGADTVTETRDADFTLTDAALTVGIEDQDALWGIEKAIITGGTSRNTTDASAFSGLLTFAGGEDDDTLIAGIGRNNFDGGPGDDTLTAGDWANLWEITGQDAGMLNGDVFTGVEILLGGALADTFVILAAVALISKLINGRAGDDELKGNDGVNLWEITSENAGMLNSQAFINIEKLIGGVDTDNFVFTDAGSIGIVDGGGGQYDTMEVQGGIYQEMTLNYSGSDSGDIELDRGIISSYSRMETIIVTSSGRGPPTTATINVLTGVSDEFILRDEGAHDNGIINIYNTNSTFTDTTFEAPTGSLTINSGEGNDTISVEVLNPDFDLFINGQAGNDTLDFSSFSSDLIITIYVEDTLSVTDGTYTTSNITGAENIIASSGLNTVVLEDGAILGGSISGSGSVALDYSPYSSDISVDLAAGTATGMVGVSNVVNVIGGSGSDILSGPSGNSTWNISGSDAGDVEGVTFSGIENLTGAANNEDTFIFEDGGSLSGLVEGGAGGFDSLVVRGTYDTIVFTPTGPDSGAVDCDGEVIIYVGLEPINAGSADDVIFNATANVDNWIIEDSPTAGQIQVRSISIETTSFDNPNNLTINLGDDDDILIIDLFGDSGFAGNIAIYGMGGDDAIFVESLNPTFTGDLIIDGGDGSDTITGPDATVSANTTWNITSTAAGNVTSSLPVSSLTFSSVENLTGGTGDDTFVFADGALGGGVDGVNDSDTDTLNLSAIDDDLTHNVHVDGGITVTDGMGYLHYQMMNDVILNTGTAHTYVLEDGATEDGVGAIGEGLDLLGDRIQAFMNDSGNLFLINGDRSVFDTYVPGVLKYDESPTIRDLLQLEVDLNKDGDKSTTELILQDIELSDGGSNGIVTFEEIFDYYFTFQVQDYLARYADQDVDPPIHEGTDPDAKLADFLTDFESFLDSIGLPYTDFWDGNYFAGDYYRAGLEVAVSASNATGDANQVTFDIDFDLIFTEYLPIDLGLQADELKISLFNITSYDPHKTYPILVGIDTTVSLDFTLGFDRIIEEFFFVVDEGNTLDVTVDNTDYDTLENRHGNVGFIGTRVGDSVDSHNVFSINLPVSTVIHDPSDPDALGFDNLPNGPEIVTVTADIEPADVVLEYDVQFILQIGDHVEPVTVTVTQAATADNADPDPGIALNNLVQDIKDAIYNASPDLAEIITVGDDGGGRIKLQLLPEGLGLTPGDIDVSDLELANEVYDAGGVITSGDLTDFEPDADVNFYLSIDGGIPRLVTVAFPDPAHTEMGFGDSQDAALEALVGQDGVAGPVLTGDASFTLTVIQNDGTEHNNVVVNVLADNTNGTNDALGRAPGDPGFDAGTAVANADLNDLVADVQAAIDDTVLSGLITVSIDDSDHLVFTGATGISYIGIVSAPLVAQTELGIAIDEVKLEMTADGPVTVLDGVLSDQAVLEIEVDTGFVNTYRVVVQPDAGNLTIADLAADLDAALADLGIPVDAAESLDYPGTIVLTAQDATVLSFTVTTVNNDIDDLIFDINHALEKVGIDNQVLAEKVDFNTFKLDSTGDESLEITRQLTLNADGHITHTELETADLDDIFLVEPPSGDFDVDLKFWGQTPDNDDPWDKTGEIWDASSPSNYYEPEGYLKVDIDPFVDGAYTVINIEGEYDRLSYLVTDDGDIPLLRRLQESETPITTSMDDLLDFNVIAAEDVIALLNQLQTWLDRLPNSPLLSSWEIPLTAAVLGDALDPGDIIEDEMLIDDQDNGISAPSETEDFNEQYRLLAFDDDENLALRFLTAQELAWFLDNIDWTGDTTTPPQESHRSLLTGDKPVKYDPASKQLTYDLGLEHVLTTLVEVPIDLSLDLSPLNSLYSESNVRIETTGHFDATMGLQMGRNQVAALQTSTTLDSLDIDVRDTLALTGAGDVTRVEGRITADATFRITVYEHDGSITSAKVVVTKTATDDNVTVSNEASPYNLITDINDALAVAEEQILTAAWTAPTIYEYTDDLNFYIRVNGGAWETVTVHAADAGLLGFGPGLLPANVLTADSELSSPFDTGADITFTLGVGPSGGDPEDTYIVTLPATGVNDTLEDLADDLQAALNDAGLAGIVTAGTSGNFLQLTADNNTKDITLGSLGTTVLNATLEDLIHDINVAINNNPDLAGKLLMEKVVDTDPFLQLRAIDNSVRKFTVQTPSTTDLGFVPTFEAEPETYTEDFTLTIQIDDETPYEVSVQNTADNTSLDPLQDLVDDVNAALGIAGLTGRVLAQKDDTGTLLQVSMIDTSIREFSVQADVTSGLVFDIAGSEARTIDLSDRIEAVLESDRVELQAIQPETGPPAVDHFTVTSAGNNTAFTQLGIRPNTATTVSLTGSEFVTDPSPGVLNFSVYLNGELTGHAVTVQNTSDNATVSDLVVDINEALAENNDLAGKITATRTGSRIVLAAVDASVEVFRVTGTDLSDLGIDNGQVAAVSLITQRSAGVAPDGTTNPELVYGRLSDNATFTIKINDDVTGIPITIQKTDTDGNESLSDLVDDILNAFAGESFDGDDLDDLITVERYGSKIRFRAISDKIQRFSISVAAGNTAVTELGLAADVSGEPKNIAEPDLQVRGSRNIPYYYGSKGDATFYVKITDDGLNSYYKVTLDVDDALTNTSVHSLVGDLNAAMANAQVVDEFWVPILSEGDPVYEDITDRIQGNKDGQRLVIEVPTQSNNDPTAPAVITAQNVTGFEITADVDDAAVKDLKLYDPTQVLPGSGDATFAANKADLLIRTADGQYYYVDLDAAADIGDVIDQIHSGTSGTLIGDKYEPVNAEINNLNTALLLTDSTSGSEIFLVDTVNRSPAAIELGIFGSDVDPVDILDGIPADGVIEGDRLRDANLADQFFIRELSPGQPFFSAELIIKTTEDPDNDPATPDELIADGAFGFVGVNLTGETDAEYYRADFSLHLADAGIPDTPNEDGNLTLTELFAALGDANNDDITGSIEDMKTVLAIDNDQDEPSFEVTGSFIETWTTVDEYTIGLDLPYTITIGDTEYDFTIYAADGGAIGFADGQTAQNELKTVWSSVDPGYDVTFTLNVGGELYTIDLPKYGTHGTKGNASYADLAADLNVALATATDSVGNTVNLVINDDLEPEEKVLAVDYFTIIPLEAGIKLISQTADPVNDPVTLTIGSLGTTADNTTLEDLENDLNDALEVGGLGDLLDARIESSELDGDRIRLWAKDTQATDFAIDIDDLGTYIYYEIFGDSQDGLLFLPGVSTNNYFLLNVELDPAFDWASETFDLDTEAKIAVTVNELGSPFADPPFLMAENTPVGTFQLTGDATFQVSVNGESPVTVTVYADDTNGVNDADGNAPSDPDFGVADTPNASLADLIDDVNDSLARYSTLEGRIEVFDNGDGKIRFEVVDGSVDVFEITAPTGNELGLAEYAESFDPGAPVTTVTGENLTDFTELGDLQWFADVDASLVLAALEKGLEFIEQFASQPALASELPFLGMSLNDMFDIAGKYRQAMASFEANPPATIQELELAFREAFGLPVNDPATAGVDEEQQFFDTFGLDFDPFDPRTWAVALDLIDGSKILQIGLRLPVGYLEDNLEVSLDLGDTGKFSGDTGLGAVGYMDVRIGLGIDVENPDPDNIFLFNHEDLTSIVGDFVVDSGLAPLNFRNTIDKRSFAIKDGSIDIDLDIDLSMPGVGSVNDYIDLSTTDITDLFDPESLDPIFIPDFTTPSFEVNLPMFTYDGAKFINDLGFDAVAAGLDAFDFNFGNGIDDFGDWDDLISVPTEIADMVTDYTDFTLFENIFAMIDGFDEFLWSIQDILDGDIFGFKLPFIGDQLSAGADFIERVRRNVIDPLEEFVQETPDLVANAIQEFLFAILGPGGDQVASIPDVIPGLGVLVKPDLDGQGKIQHLDDIGSGDYSSSYIDSIILLTGDQDQDSVQWDFRLGGDWTPDFDVEFDLGWPALNLEMDAELLIELQWSLIMGIGISLDKGVFLDIDHGGDDLTVDLGVEIATGSTATGRLAFLQLEVEALDDDFDGIEGDGPNDTDKDPTRFEASFGVDLTGGDNNHLQLSNLFGGLGIDMSFSAGAEVNLGLEVKFNEDILPDTISALLPSVKTTFLLDWEISSDDVAEFDLGADNTLTLVAFDEVTIDMGSFIGDLLGPVVDKIQEITEPLQPIVDVLTARIPVLSDLAGRTITLIDIAGMTGYVEPAMIYAIADLITFVNSIPAEPGSLEVSLGDFALIKTSNDYDDRIGGNLFTELSGGSLLDSNFNLGDDSNFDMAGSLPDGFTDNIGGFLGSMNSSGGDSTTQNTMNNLIGSGGAGGGFAFPILENPSQVFGLLLGKPAALVTYDLAPLGLEFTWSTSFMIWGPLWARITASLGVTADFAFGYDTEGIARFIEGHLQNPLDLLAGFFVSDTDLPEGTGGTDVPELVLKGSVFAGAELSAAGLASAGVEGGVILTVNFDLYDPDRDGRVRIDELVNTFLYELRNGNPILAPISIFDVYGDISAQLRAYIRALFFDFTFEITPPITLYEFSIDFEREPILATERADALLLNMGPNSESRLNGNTADIGETINVDYQGGSSWEVYSSKLGVDQGGAQVYSAGAKLIAYGGEGDDTVIVDLKGHSNPVEIEFYGEGGNDKLEVKNGLANVTAYGGLGNDTFIINTTGGKNVIYGQEGGDRVEISGPSSSVVFGDQGKLRVNRQTGIYDVAQGRLNSETDGIDTISTDSGKDVIFGGGKEDIIRGGGGSDLIVGDGGYFIYENGQVPSNSPTIDISAISIAGSGDSDLIFGGAGDDAIFGCLGDDIIDGGAGYDQIIGGKGADTLYGGSGGDDIYGGKGKDVIFGYRDPLAGSDTADTADSVADGGDLIYGDEDQDYVRGNAGDDVIYGGTEDDTLFGDTENDLIYGGLGNDLIFGGAHSDIITGAEGSDVVFGDDGLVAYINFDSGLTPQTAADSLIRIAQDPDDPFNHKVIGDADDGFVLGLIEDVLDAGFAGQVDSDPASPDLYLTEVKTSDGNDVIAGGAGDDIVLGGAGSDWVGGDLPVFKTYTDNPIDLDTDFHEYSGDSSKDGRPVIIDSAPGNPDAYIDLGGGKWLELTTGLPAPEENPAGEDVLIGDGGQIEFVGRRYSRIISLDEAPLGGQTYVDTLFGDNGEDIGFGGTGGDTIYGGHRGGLGSVPQLVVDGVPQTDADGNPVYNDDDVLLGDNGVITFEISFNNYIETISTNDTAEETGGADTIDGKEGDDIILGGVNDGGQDTLSGNVGHDVLLGDNGYLDFVYLGDPDATTLELVQSFIDGWGGTDVISGDTGRDTVMGGTGADMIYGNKPDPNTPDLDHPETVAADDYQDILLGDSGVIRAVGDVEGRLTVLGSAVKYIHTTDETNATGGGDTIEGNAMSDVIIGGVSNGETDTLYGDAATPIVALDGDDVILGDNGLLHFAWGDERTPPRYGFENYDDYSDSDSDLTTLDLIATRQYKVEFNILTETFTEFDTVPPLSNRLGGDDVISGNRGSDTAFGGVGSDTIYGDDASTSAGEDDDGDILLGDNAQILLDGQTDELGPSTPIPGKLVVLNSAVRLIETTDTQEETGAADNIYGSMDDDIIVGGVNQGGEDNLFGNEHNDIILGDNGLLNFDYRFGIGEPEPEGETEQNLTTLDLLVSSIDGLGGVDNISGDQGYDTAMGGMDGDNIYGDNETASNGAADGEDILIGDNAAILLSGDVLDYVDEGRLHILDSSVNMIHTIDEVNTTGGSDLIEGNAAADVIVGGVNGANPAEGIDPFDTYREYLYGDAENPNVPDDGEDVILGDNGILDFAYDGTLHDHLPGYPLPGLVLANDDLSTLDLVQARPYAVDSYTVIDGDDGFELITPMTPVLLGGEDVISGNRGSDTGIGGVDDDILYGDDDSASAAGFDGRDILLGDNGEIFLHGHVG
ncbi:MAG: LEPR-XLL domain-containing protein, partial [Planctomycetota bacterium]